MRSANLPLSLTTDELIQRQVDHARLLGYSAGDVAFLAYIQKQKARQLGHELFHAFTVIAIHTDFMESLDDCQCVRMRSNQNA
jgi:predicted membrane channel-forming protein YqfA (hemolysin III family)